MNIIPVAVIDINSGTVSGDMVISDLTIITLTLNSYSYNIQVGIIQSATLFPSLVMVNPSTIAPAA